MTNKNPLIALSIVCGLTQACGGHTFVSQPEPQNDAGTEAGDAAIDGKQPEADSANLNVKLSAQTQLPGIRVTAKPNDSPFARYEVQDIGTADAPFDTLLVKAECRDGGSCAKNITCLWAVTKVNAFNSCTLDANGIGELKTDKPFALVPKETIVIDFGATLAQTVPKSQSGANLPRSGDQLRLRLVGIKTGANSDQAQIDQTPPNDMLVRKSKITISNTPPLPKTLVNGEVELYNFSAACDSASPCTTKQFMFNITPTGGVQLGLFKLIRDLDTLDPTLYKIVEAKTGVDLTNGWFQSQLTATVSFVNQDSLTAGQTVAYSLRSYATITGQQQTATVIPITKYEPGKAYQPNTGYLVNNNQIDAYGSWPDMYNVADYDSPNNWHVLGTLIWSDMSESPHDAMIKGSKDWTDDLYVEGWGKAVTLTQ